MKTNSLVVVTFSVYELHSPIDGTIKLYIFTFIYKLWILYVFMWINKKCFDKIIFNCTVFNVY